jgi:hypothetical protein
MGMQQHTAVRLQLKSELELVQLAVRDSCWKLVVEEEVGL